MTVLFFLPHVNAKEGVLKVTLTGFIAIQFVLNGL